MFTFGTHAFLLPLSYWFNHDCHLLFSCKSFDNLYHLTSKFFHIYIIANFYKNFNIFTNLLIFSPICTNIGPMRVAQALTVVIWFSLFVPVHLPLSILQEPQTNDKLDPALHCRLLIQCLHIQQEQPCGHFPSLR